MTATGSATRVRAAEQAASAPPAAGGGWRGRLLRGLAPVLVAVGLLAVGLGIGRLAIAAPPPPPVSEQGQLRVGHLAPDTPPLDASVTAQFGTEQLALPGIAYPEVSSVLMLRPGAWRVDLLPAGFGPATAPVLSTVVQVAPGRSYTVTGFGPHGGLHLADVVDASGAPAGGASVRLLNAGTRDGLRLDVPGATGTGPRLVSGAASAYIDVPAGPFAGSAAVPGTEPVKITGVLSAGCAYTALVTDDRSRPPTLVSDGCAAIPAAGASAAGRDRWALGLLWAGAILLVGAFVVRAAGPPRLVPAAVAAAGMLLSGIGTGQLAAVTATDAVQQAADVTGPQADAAPGPALDLAELPAVPREALVTPLAAAVPADPGVTATGVQVPAVGLDVPLQQLALDPSGALAPPASPAKAGWYRGSAVPGDVGIAVVVGHVDSRAGPGVFFRLKELSPGDELTMRRSDGATVRFRVEAVEFFAKAEFPTDRIFGATPRPELRLITCGGEFDRSTRHYRDNVVVYAAAVR